MNDQNFRQQDALRELKEEHGHVLELCSRIREGLKRKVETRRIRNYAEWFKVNYLEPHFEIEEGILLPLLGTNARVKRALANHRRIKKLLSCGCEDIKVLNLLEEELATHVRFEERVLFNEVKAVAGEDKLQEVEMRHRSIPFEDKAWKDRFWVT